MNGILILALAACSAGNGAPDAYTGTVEIEEIDVAALLPGRLLEVKPRRGDSVEQGQVLFRVDTTALDAQRDAAVAAAERARAAVAMTRAQAQAADAQVRVLQRETDRVERLVEAGGATAQQLSQLQGQLEVARAQRGAAWEGIAQAEAAVEQAEATIRALDAQLDQAVAEAPADGLVLSRNREPGEVVGAGMSVLTLGDVQHPKLQIYVPLRTVESISLGDVAQVRLDSGAAVQGRVSWIAAEAEFTPRDILTPEERVKQVFAVELALEPGPGIHPGIPADAVFEGSP